MLFRCFSLFRCCSYTFHFLGAFHFSGAFPVLFTFQVCFSCAFTFKVLFMSFSLFMCFSCKVPLFMHERPLAYIHGPPNTYVCIDAPHTHTCTNKHTCAPPNITKTYIVGLPSVLYETPGLNKKSVLNQLFLLLFSVAFHFSGAFHEKAQHFSYKVLWAFGWSPSIGLSFERPNIERCPVCFLTKYVMYYVPKLQYLHQWISNPFW